MRPNVLMAVIVMSALLVYASAAQAQAQSDADKKQAQALQTEGLRLMQRGDQRAALDKFEQAFRLVPSPKILFNMGKAHQAMGDDVEALTAFERFLDEAPYAPKESRDEASRAVRMLRPKVAYIEVQTDDVGARVAIDGQDVGTAPLPRPTAVRPGSHDVRIELSGMTPEKREVSPIAGQKLRVVVKLVRPTASAPPAAAVAVAPPPVAAPPLPAAPPPPVAPPAADQKRTDPAADPGSPWQIQAGWIAAGVSALSLGAGIAAQVMSSSKNADFNAVTNAPNPTGMCNKPALNAGGGDCPVLLDAANRYQRYAIIGYVGAGVAAAGALVFFLSAPSRGDGEGKVAVSCLPFQPAGGASCTAALAF
jgi:PEGA domain